MRYLRQSTTVTVQVGPFLDATDGVTAEDGLAGSMTVQISKAGAAYANRNSATAIAFDADGWYRVELNTTDTATVGPLMLKSRVSGAAPVWHEFTVLASTRYDVAIAGTAVGTANVTQIDGLATSGNNATLNLKSLNINNSTGSAMLVTSSGSNGHAMVLTGNGSGDGLHAQGGATGHGIEAVGGASDGVGLNVLGAGAGAGFQASGGTFGTGAEIVGGGSGGDGMTISSAGDGYVGLTVKGSGTDAVGFFAQGGTGTGAGIVARGGSTGGDGFVATALAGDGHGIIATGNGTGKALGDAAVDCILNRDMTTPTGVPAATATLASALGRIYQGLRNKVTVTATEKTFFDDSGTATFKKTLADSGSTYTEDEGTTP